MSTTFLTTELTNSLHDHAAMVSKGVDSEQAARIAFSNEEDLAEIYARQTSDCCNAPVEYDAPDLSPWCTKCNNFCSPQ